MTGPWCPSSPALFFGHRAVEEHQALSDAPARGKRLLEYAARAVGGAHRVFVHSRGELALRLDPGAMRAAHGVHHGTLHRLRRIDVRLRRGPRVERSARRAE